jgi:hypothetical protein
MVSPETTLLHRCLVTSCTVNKDKDAFCARSSSTLSPLARRPVSGQLHFTLLHTEVAVRQHLLGIRLATPLSSVDWMNGFSNTTPTKQSTERRGCSVRIDREPNEVPMCCEVCFLCISGIVLLLKTSFVLLFKTSVVRYGVRLFTLSKNSVYTSVS